MAEIIELEKNEPTEEEKKAILENVMDAISDFAPDGENGEEVFGALLSMEDEQFNILAPIFLDEIAKAYTDPSTQLLLVNIMNTQGVKYEDMVESYNTIIESLDNEIDDTILSKPKKDFLKRILVLILNSLGETQATAKRIIDIPFMKLNENAKMPAYAHVGDAAADLYALESYDIDPGEQIMIKTGIACAIPNGYAMLIQPRSGLSSKSKLRICNTPGLIDSGYRGEICVLMENVDAKIKDLVIDDDGKATGILYGSSYHIDAGDRIAQARLVEVPSMAFEEVKELGDTDRGEGGFGSTGE